MVSQLALEPPSIRRDGFGTRLIEHSAKPGRVERLTLSPALATPGSEQAIRARAAYMMRLEGGPIGRVVRIERKGRALSILCEVPDGVTLSDVLAALEFNTLTLSDDEVLELAAVVVRAASHMHEALGTLAHGALSSGHVVITREGSALFTGTVFADALQALNRNREHWWREFGLTLPSSASVPRFDQRGDVAQLGGLVLAIGQRRCLGRDEFPRKVGDLIAATSLGSNAQVNALLRTWLQDALQLHGRVVFDSCVEAARKFARILPKGGGDEDGTLALRTAILQLCSEPPSSSTATAIWPSSPDREFSQPTFA